MPQNRIVFGASYWDFIAIKGYPDLPGMELKRISKHGVNGSAYKEMQFSADPTPIYMESIATSLISAASFISDMKNLQGTQVNIYDAVGNVYNNVVVNKVTHNRTKGLLKAVWGGVHYSSVYKISWQMIVHYPYGSF